MAQCRERLSPASVRAAAAPGAHAPVSAAEAAYRRLAQPAAVAGAEAAALEVTATPATPARGAVCRLQGRGVWRGGQNSAVWHSAAVSRAVPGGSAALQQSSWSQARSLGFLTWGNPCGGGENMLA